MGGFDTLVALLYRHGGRNVFQVPVAGALLALGLGVIGALVALVRTNGQADVAFGATTTLLILHLGGTATGITHEIGHGLVIHHR